MALTKLKLAQTRVTEDYDFGGFKLTNLNAPVAANDATRKAYVDSEVAKVAGAMTYKGTWDASSNTPTLPAADVSNKGHYYVVATAGATEIDGVSDWEQRDWVVSNGSEWEKIDNTDKVTAVFGRTGPITAEAGDYNAGQVTFTPAGSLAATDVQAALVEVDGDVAALTARVATAEADIDTLESDVSDIETAATALTDRVSTAEGDIDALEGRATTAETDIDALEGRATALEGRATEAEEDIAALEGRMDAAETAATALEEGKLDKALASGHIFVGSGDGEAVAATFVVREAPTAAGDFSTYTLAGTPAAGTEQVFLNGLLLDVTDDYTISGAVITPASALSATDKVRVSYIALDA